MIINNEYFYQLFLLQRNKKKGDALWRPHSIGSIVKMSFLPDYFTNKNIPSITNTMNATNAINIIVTAATDFRIVRRQL